MKNINEFVYRIFKKNEFDDFIRNLVFKGNVIDKNSGFIHMSTKNQIKGTLNLYFKEEKEIYIVKFRVSNLGNLLKWEKSRNNDLFPHYYGTLKSRLIIKKLQKNHI